jgi:hypothetical protein
MAVQKALPNASSAHAVQFAGSPEQLAGRVLCGVEGGAVRKIGFTLNGSGLRRRGTGGW